MTRIESVEQIEALPVGSVIDDKYIGYHVRYTKLESGKFEIEVLAAPGALYMLITSLDADEKNAAGGLPAEMFQRGLDAGADLTVLATEGVAA